MRANFTCWALAVGVIGITGIAGRPAMAADPPVLEEGQPFPDIVLPSMRDGRRMSIADFRGQKVVLHVFASW